MSSKKDKQQKKRTKEKTKEEPKTDLYMPISWWSQILKTLDHKVRGLAEMHGFGKINLTIDIFNGTVRDVIFTDELRVRHNQNPKEEGSTLTQHQEK